MDASYQERLLQWTEAELREEAALSLGRVGRRLEASAARLHELAERWPQLTPDERQTAREEERIVRERFRYLRWSLGVQREAMGLRLQEAVELAYPEPPPLPPDER